MLHTICMYIGIDIGASKTLIASFTDSLEMVGSEKFATPKDPKELVKEVAKRVVHHDKHSELMGVGVAVPGRNKGGFITNTTTLGWHKVPLLKMLSEHINVNICIENDAMLGGLCEARMGNGRSCTNLLYITISTGVGTGIIIDGQIPEFMPGSEGGHMFTGGGKEPKTVEELVSGTAFKQRFGTYGYETEDPKIWRQYGRDLAEVVFDMSALLEPSCVIIGGGMAVHWNRFSSSLNERLKELHDEIFDLPEIKPARYPETAVIHGCAIIAKEGGEQ